MGRSIVAPNTVPRYIPDATIVLDERTFDEDGDMYFAYADLGTAFSLDENFYAVGVYSSNAAARIGCELSSK